MNRSIFRHLYPVYMLVMSAALFIQTLVTLNVLNEQVTINTYTDLKHQNQILTNFFDPSILASAEDVKAFCEQAAENSEFRISIILADGTLCGDSQRIISLADNHSDRPEIISALQGIEGTAMRTSSNIGTELLYVASPLRDSNQRIIAVLRSALATSVMSSELFAFSASIIIVSLMVLLTSAALFYILSQRISTPLWNIQYAAKKYAEGDLDYRFKIDKPDELRAFAGSLNHMANEIRQRISMVTKRSSELEAVLANMREAVIVLDTDLMLKQINPAGEKLFLISQNNCKGSDFFDHINNEEIKNFALEILNSETPQSSEFEIIEPSSKFINANGTCLLHTDGRKRGLLLVFNDQTNIKKLETIRKDFVANVSHELRTPITSIKGFAETLLDGAADDPDTRERFLTIITQHSERIEALISDLLSLSKLEEDDSAQISLTKINAKLLLNDCIVLMKKNAEAKNIHIRLQCNSKIIIVVNPNLFQQAIINLLDNAIKYSDKNTLIEINVHQVDEQIRINVSDQGAGIPAEDLPMIFQRFYRIDKARSRSLGGTGLGLAIVKHIILAHNGQVAAESTLNKGSIFKITLPSTNLQG